MTITYNSFNGKFFGYPECCIETFGDVAIPYMFRPEKVQKSAINGFLPCEKCATKLLNKEVTYQDLIKDRICSVPFKENPTHEENYKIDKELDEYQKIYG